MYFVPQSRQKEDEEVSSQATTLQFGSPGKSRWEEYVCPGYPHCENFDCDLCEDPPETEADDVNEANSDARPNEEVKGVSDDANDEAWPGRDAEEKETNDEANKTNVETNEVSDLN